MRIDIENLTIQEAKVLHEMGLITDEEYMNFVQAKAAKVKEVVANEQRKNAKTSIQMF